MSNMVTDRPSIFVVSTAKPTVGATSSSGSFVKRATIVDLPLLLRPTMSSPTLVCKKAAGGYATSLLNCT